MSIHHNIIYGIHNDTQNRIFVSDTRPCDKDKIKCEICSNILIPKKGNIKIHHYAHKSSDIINCDDWAPKFKSDIDHHWHLQWQYFFKNNDFGDIECVIKKEIDNKIICHRADIITKTNYIIEIQHSTISDHDVVKREEFYGDKLIWIVDGRNTNFNFLFYTENNFIIGQYHKEFIYSFKRNVFIDTDYGLFELIKILNDRYCIIKKINSKLKTECKKLTKCFEKNTNMSDINNKLKEYMSNNDLGYLDIDDIKKNLHYCLEYNNDKDIFILNNKFTSPILQKCDYTRIGDICYNLYNDNFLKNFDDQPEELIIYSIRNNHNNYEYIKNKSYELDKKLLNINGLILQFINNQSGELCIIACENNINAYNFIKDKSDDLNKKLLNINGLLLKFIDNQNDELCEIACRNNIDAYKYIKNKSYDLDKKLLNINGLILQFIDTQTDDLCEISCNNNIDAYKYIKTFTKKIINFINLKSIDLCKKLISSNGLLLEFIDNQNDELCEIACKNNINAYKFINNKSYELDKILLNIDGRILQFIDTQTDELCEIAIKNNYYTYNYIKNKSTELDKKLLNVNIRLLELIDNKTYDLYNTIINNANIDSYKSILNKYNELDKLLLNKNGLLLKYIENQTDELCIIACRNTLDAYYFIKNKSDELNQKLISINGLLLKFMTNQDDRMCINAIKQNPNSYQYVRNKNKRIKMFYEKWINKY
jgi:competence CoiA-like predicted nuclease